jgi:hypothetical protein
MKQDPMREWVVRDEILAAFHRWPVIVAFALVGTLLGLVFAYFWPSFYRANVALSVELNPYRVLDDQYIPEFTNAEFRNIDDYKHWQMLQLSIVVKSDPYLNETLNRLRALDRYWDSIELQDLRMMLDAKWRNAGQWLLIADAEKSPRAVEAVETWRDVILNLTNDSITHSRDLFNLELTLRSLNDELVENKLQQAALEETMGGLIDALNGLNNAEGDFSPSEPDRNDLFTLANRIAESTLGGHIVVKSFPDEGVPISEYIVWVEQAILIVQKDIDSSKVADAALNEQISSVTSKWEAGIQEAQGLSATLSLKKPQAREPEVRQVRSYSLAALIGTLVGLLLWIMVFLIQITRKGYL